MDYELIWTEEATIDFDREGVRRLLITKRYSLIYVVIVDQIYLLRVYDNRSNPEEMAF